MTKEEAINRIKILKPMINPPTDKQVGWLETWIYKEDIEAIDMAVEIMCKYKKIEAIIKDHDNDRMPEDYWYIDRIREVLEYGKIG